MKLGSNQENFINNIMGWTFAQITAKRAAIRQPGYGVDSMAGIRTYDQVMRRVNGNASLTVVTEEPLPENNIFTINGNNLTRINDNNLVRIS